MSNFKFQINKIKPFLIAFMALTLFVASCTSKKEVVNTDELVKISQPRVFTNTFKNGLYKTDMKVYDRELSGLLFFNKKGSSMRVVMLSEVGLKYFDIELISGKKPQYIVHQLIDFLDHDKFKSSIQNFISLLMIDLTAAHQTYKKEDLPGYLIREVNADKNKNTYTYNSNSGAISNITQSGGHKAIVTLTDYDYLAPGSIKYDQGKVRYSLEKVEKE